MLRNDCKITMDGNKILLNIFQYLNLLVFKRKFDICKYFFFKIALRIEKVFIFAA